MAPDQLLRRNFWAVTLVLVGSVALLNAQGITQVVGAGLGADEKQLAAAPPVTRSVASAESSVPSRTVSAESIIVRNPFDSVTGALNKPPPAPEPSASAPPVPTIVDPYAAPPCDGVKLLVITASTDPDWSFAAFSTGADGKSLLRRRGGEVGNKQVKYIAWDRVWMTSGTALCQTTMFRPPGTPSAPPPPPPPPQLPSAPAGGASPVPPEISKGVVRVSGTEFNIDRSVVDRILDNQADLMRQARIVPEQENGKVVGIRLFGVRPDTLLGVLGMENGDRLEKINGFEMASPEKALEAYARLRTADHLTVQVNRRGQAVNLDFNIK